MYAFPMSNKCQCHTLNKMMNPRVHIFLQDTSHNLLVPLLYWMSLWDMYCKMCFHYQQHTFLQDMLYMMIDPLYFDNNLLNKNHMIVHHFVNFFQLGKHYNSIVQLMLDNIQHYMMNIDLNLGENKSLAYN